MPENAPQGGVAEVVSANALTVSPAEDEAQPDESAEALDPQDADAREKAARREAKAARKAAKAEERERKALEKAEKKAAKKASEASQKTAAAVLEKAERAERALQAAEEAPASGDGADSGVTRKGRLRFESEMDREELASYFEAIVAGLRKGSVQFRQAESEVTLSPAERIELGMKVSSKNGRERLSFDVEWSTDEPEALRIVPG
jgi:amphi-Trp domain-containing protein